MFGENLHTDRTKIYVSVTIWNSLNFFYNLFWYFPEDLLKYVSLSKVLGTLVSLVILFVRRRLTNIFYSKALNLKSAFWIPDIFHFYLSLVGIPWSWWQPGPQSDRELTAGPRDEGLLLSCHSSRGRRSAAQEWRADPQHHRRGRQRQPSGVRTLAV